MVSVGCDFCDLGNVFCTLLGIRLRSFTFQALKLPYFYFAEEHKGGVSAFLLFSGRMWRSVAELL